MVSRTVTNVSSLFGCPKCVWSSLLDWLSDSVFALISTCFVRLFVGPPIPELVGRPSLGVSGGFCGFLDCGGPVVVWPFYGLTGAHEF